MTPSPAQQPQREYIITESIIEDVCAVMLKDAIPVTDTVYKLLRSCPYPPAPATLGNLIAKTNAESMQAMIDEQCKEAARTATLAAMERVSDFIDKVKYNHVVNYSDLAEYLDTIRWQSTTAGDEQR
jgi:hypothetical protein